MFGLIPLIESFFFLSLGITFILIFLMVFHFKQRIEKLERNNNDLSDLCNKIVKEVTNLHMVYLNANTNSNSNIPKNYYQKENIVISTSNYSQNKNIPQTEESEPLTFKKIIVMDTITNDDNAVDVDIDDDDESGDEEYEYSDDDVDSGDEDVDIHVQENDNIQVFKLPEEDGDGEVDLVVVEEEEATKKMDELEVDLVVVEDEEKPKKEKSNFHKMNVQDLKILAISKGLCSDTTKMKKADLIKLLEEEEENPL
jgi:hypothetical protein